MRELGVTIYLSLKDVFSGEAEEFTPWLSSNLDRLAGELGFELEPEDTEVRVGSFKADIRAKTTDGRTVIIENQFHTTDHSHLGQLLTYASGLEADVVIWIAERVRDEHRAAIDWLNAKAADADFFAIEARVMQIDESKPDVRWDVVASPNNWSRLTKKTGSTRVLTDAQQERIDYWASLNELIETMGEKLTRFSPDNITWQGGTIGKSDFGLNTSINRQDGWIRVEIYLGGNRAKTRFETLHDRKDEIEADLGYGLDWDHMEGRQACRISTSYDCDPSNRTDWPNQHAWIIDKRKEFERVFRPLAKVIS